MQVDFYQLGGSPPERVIASIAGWIAAEATGWSVNETLVPMILLIVGSIVAQFSGLCLLVLLLAARAERRYR